MTLSLYRFPMVEAALREPIKAQAGEGILTFFTRSYLVWASDETEALAKVRADLSDEASLLDFDPAQSVELSALDATMQRYAMDRREGVCWRSGRIFYPPD